ncbi:MAG: HNH endonuclease signature motif containing protein [Azonexus sp.]|nr:HNH endonuclease signature motif containing protein [Azonexus sp.]
MEITTLGELLHWSYANLAMAHSAITAKADKYGRTHFMIRSRLYKGLNNQTMSIGPLANDERLKMVLPQACCYCGSRDYLSVDHLIPTKRGGANSGDNLVWACRSCNSSKCARDALEWLMEKNQFPPILLLRRYLKLAIEISRERNLMDTPLAETPELPFSLSAIPQTFPQPSQLRLWVVEMAQPGVPGDLR